MYAILVAGLLAQTSPTGPDAVTTVEEVVADGSYAEFRLVTDIGGALAADTLIVSGAPAMYCSGGAYQYEPGPARQCWLRARVNTVRLEARATGRHGADWNVDWNGCTPVEGGRACEVTVNRETLVGARFRRG